MRIGGLSFNLRSHSSTRCILLWSTFKTSSFSRLGFAYCNVRVCARTFIWFPDFTHTSNRASVFGHNDELSAEQRILVSLHLLFCVHYDTPVPARHFLVIVAYWASKREFWCRFIRDYVAIMSSIMYCSCCLKASTMWTTAFSLFAVLERLIGGALTRRWTLMKLVWG